MLMGELQRYRAQGGPLSVVVRRFVSEIDDAGAYIDHDVRERLAALAQAPGALDDAEQRWIRNQLPEIVRQIALLDAAPGGKRSIPDSAVSKCDI